MSFIKTGMDYLKPSGRKEIPSNMSKFPEDVITAEKLTGGDPNILNDPQIVNVQKVSITELLGFTTAKKAKKAAKQPVVCTSDAAETPLPHLKDSQDLCQKFINDDEKSQYKRCYDEYVGSSYACQFCAYTTSRYNLLMFHTVYHRTGNRGNLTLTTPPISKIKNRGVNSSTSQKRKGSYSRLSGCRPSKKRLSLLQSESADKSDEVESDLKKQNDVIRDNILKDWDDSSSGSVESDKHSDDDKLNISTQTEGKTKTVLKSSEKSCFDFEDNEDYINLDTSLKFGQKLPRVLNNGKPKKKIDVLLHAQANISNDSGDDCLSKNFKLMLEETTVPNLPKFPPKNCNKPVTPYSNAGRSKVPVKRELRDKHSVPRKRRMLLGKYQKCIDSSAKGSGTESKSSTPAKQKCSAISNKVQVKLFSPADIVESTTESFVITAKDPRELKSHISTEISPSDVKIVDSSEVNDSLFSAKLDVHKEKLASGSFLNQEKDCNNFSATNAASSTSTGPKPVDSPPLDITADDLSSVALKVISNKNDVQNVAPFNPANKNISTELMINSKEIVQEENDPIPTSNSSPIQITDNFPSLILDAINKDETFITGISLVNEHGSTSEASAPLENESVAASDQIESTSLLPAFDYNPKEMENFEFMHIPKKKRLTIAAKVQDQGTAVVEHAADHNENSNETHSDIVNPLPNTSGLASQDLIDNKYEVLNKISSESNQLEDDVESGLQLLQKDVILNTENMEFQPKDLINQQSQADSENSLAPLEQKQFKISLDQPNNEISVQRDDESNRNSESLPMTDKKDAQLLNLNLLTSREECQKTNVAVIDVPHNFDDQSTKTKESNNATLSEVTVLERGHNFLTGNIEEVKFKCDPSEIALDINSMPIIISEDYLTDIKPTNTSLESLSAEETPIIVPPSTVSCSSPSVINTATVSTLSIPKIVPDKLKIELRIPGGNYPPAKNCRIINIPGRQNTSSRDFSSILAKQSQTSGPIGKITTQGLIQQRNANVGNSSLFLVKPNLAQTSISTSGTNQKILTAGQNILLNNSTRYVLLSQPGESQTSKIVTVSQSQKSLTSSNFGSKIITKNGHITQIDTTQNTANNKTPLLNKAIGNAGPSQISKLSSQSSLINTKNVGSISATAQKINRLLPTVNQPLRVVNSKASQLFFQQKKTTNSILPQVRLVSKTQTNTFVLQTTSPAAVTSPHVGKIAAAIQQPTPSTSGTQPQIKRPPTTKSRQVSPNILQKTQRKPARQQPVSAPLLQIQPTPHTSEVEVVNIPVIQNLDGVDVPLEPLKMVYVSVDEHGNYHPAENSLIPLEGVENQNLYITTSAANKLIVQVDPRALLSSINSTAITTIPCNDILAKALANTQVLQNEESDNADSLDSSALLVNQQCNVPTLSHNLETSFTINQPIMTPLEVPSAIAPLPQIIPSTSSNTVIESDKKIDMQPSMPLLTDEMETEPVYLSSPPQLSPNLTQMEGADFNAEDTIVVPQQVIVPGCLPSVDNSTLNQTSER